MRSILAAFMVAMFVGSAAAADAKIDGKKIVGKWEITKAFDDTPKGTIIEFAKDGKVTISVDINGKKMEVGGKYEIKVDKLTVSITPPGEGKEYTETNTIKTLTDEKLILIEKNGTETEMTRKK